MKTLTIITNREFVGPKASTKMNVFGTSFTGDWKLSNTEIVGEDMLLIIKEARNIYVGYKCTIIDVKASPREDRHIIEFIWSSEGVDLPTAYRKGLGQHPSQFHEIDLEHLFTA